MITGLIFGFGFYLQIFCNLYILFSYPTYPWGVLSQVSACFPDIRASNGTRASQMFAKQSSSVASHLRHQLVEWEITCVEAGTATWRQRRTRSCSESFCSQHLLSEHRLCRLSSPLSLWLIWSIKILQPSVFLPLRVSREGEWWDCWASRSASCSSLWGRSRNPPPADQMTVSPHSSRQSEFQPRKPTQIMSFRFLGPGQGNQKARFP